MNLQKAIAICEKGLTFDVARQSGLSPSLEILNSFFQCGIDDAESEITLNWDPFVLTGAEYTKFHKTCVAKFGELRVDNLGFHHYAEWFSAVAVRNQGSI